jgi:hypothetical protein
MEDRGAQPASELGHGGALAHRQDSALRRPLDDGRRRGAPASAAQSGRVQRRFLARPTGDFSRIARPPSRRVTATGPKQGVAGQGRRPAGPRFDPAHFGSGLGRRSDHPRAHCGDHPRGTRRCSRGIPHRIPPDRNTASFFSAGPATHGRLPHRPYAFFLLPCDGSRPLEPAGRDDDLAGARGAAARPCPLDGQQPGRGRAAHSRIRHQPAFPARVPTFLSRRRHVASARAAGRPEAGARALPRPVHPAPPLRRRPETATRDRPRRGGDPGRFPADFPSPPPTSTWCRSLPCPPT